MSSGFYYSCRDFFTQKCTNANPLQFSGHTNPIDIYAYYPDFIFQTRHGNCYTAPLKNSTFGINTLMSSDHGRHSTVDGMGATVSRRITGLSVLAVSIAR